MRIIIKEYGIDRENDYIISVLYIVKRCEVKLNLIKNLSIFDIFRENKSDHLRPAEHTL